MNDEEYLVQLQEEVQRLRRFESEAEPGCMQHKFWVSMVEALYAEIERLNHGH